MLSSITGQMVSTEKGNKLMQPTFQNEKWLSRDTLLISFSAFFADLGYQGVTALYPLFLVIDLRVPVYWYGLVTAASFGIGSLFAYVGGRAGDRFDKKYVSIAGNIFIPLMSLSGLTHTLWLSAVLFILGWWARYFRTPARRALLVNVSEPEKRAKAFGFLHALDIAGGMLSAGIAILFLQLHIPVGKIILYSALPLFVSTVLLFFVERKKVYVDDHGQSVRQSSGKITSSNKIVFTMMLVSATFYGFSFYNLGFPILSVSSANPGNSGYTLGVLAFALYLGVSAISGYLLGSSKVSPLRSLWTTGYFLSALASCLIGVSESLHLTTVAFYIFIAVLGFGMGAVETFEPTLTADLIHSSTLSKGMGWLSVSRSIGQLMSNLIMGILFSLSRSAPYYYAFGAALVATVLLAVADIRYGSRSGTS